MKRGLLCIAAVLVLAAGALWLASLRNYDAADAVEENGAPTLPRKDHGAALPASIGGTAPATPSTTSSPTRCRA